MLSNARADAADLRRVLSVSARADAAQARRRREAKPSAIRVDDRIRESARAILPFRLTDGQKSALKEIVEDMQRPTPMNRLLQGDVGAGKTIVALLAALVAMENGLQVAFMAPTEILAEQHFLSLRKLLEQSRFRVELITGATAGLRRRDLLARLAAGDIHLVVGTHALVQGTVNFRSLGLAVIDEQHRFGVVQRATLRAKGLMPDVLVMTATPIPRTLALTVYGDLDVSVIRDMPPGRRAIRTTVKPESRREDVYESVRKQLDEGRQAYVVYPLIEESEKVDLRAATEMADHLAQEVFPAYRVALLHGRMKQDAKDRVMRAFAAGDIHVLVSTTVIEVGIDVPNATVMVDRACGAIRIVATAPAARPRRTRQRTSPLRPAVSISDLEAGKGAVEGAGRHDGRIRDGGARSPAARAGRFFRHAAIRAAYAANGRFAARPRAHGTGTRRSRALSATEQPRRRRWWSS